MQLDQYIDLDEELQQIIEKLLLEDNYCFFWVVYFDIVK